MQCSPAEGSPGEIAWGLLLQASHTALLQDKTHIISFKHLFKTRLAENGRTALLPHFSVTRGRGPLTRTPPALPGHVRGSAQGHHYCGLQGRRAGDKGEKILAYPAPPSFREGFLLRHSPRLCLFTKCTKRYFGYNAGCCGGYTCPYVMLRHNGIRRPDRATP